MNEKAETSSDKFEKKDVGNNVRLEIEFGRHGTKDDFNAREIIDAEKVTAIARSRDISKYNLVSVRSTPVPRAVDTLRAIEEGYADNPTLSAQKVTARIQTRPTGVLNSGGTHRVSISAEASEDINIMSPHLRELYKNAVNDDPESTWKKEDAGVQVMIRNLSDKLGMINRTRQEIAQSRPLSDESRKELQEFKALRAEEGGISILEVSLRFTEHLASYLDATGRLQSNTSALIDEVNHAGFIEPFLLYLFGDLLLGSPVRPDGVTDLDKIGGAFEPNEKVTLIIERKQRGELPSLILKLRDRIYTIPPEDLAQRIIESKKLSALLNDQSL